jgi:hypothetical protein
VPVVDRLAPAMHRPAVRRTWRLAGVVLIGFGARVTSEGA